MARRTPGEGSVYLRKKDHRWVAIAPLSERNGRRRRQAFYGDSAEAARNARSDWLVKNGADSSKLTLEQYSRRWLADVSPDLKPKTVQSYTQLLDMHIIPSLGSKRLSDIERGHIKALLREKRTSGKVVTKQGVRRISGLSKNTCRLIRATLSAMFAEALDDGLVTSNPALALSRRRGKKRADGMSAAERVNAIRPFATHEIAAILDAAETHEPDYYPLFLLLARTGARPGEAAGLQWSDINFEKREALIERAISAGEVGTTKTEGIRTVDLSQELSDVLKALHGARAAQKLKHKWSEMPEWVFCNSDGNPLDESRTRKKFAKVMKKAGVSGHRTYDLRHAWATTMLGRGVPITYVAAQLGHAKPSTTLQWYARWLPQDSKAYVDSLDSPESTLSAAAG